MERRDDGWAEFKKTYPDARIKAVSGKQKVVFTDHRGIIRVDNWPLPPIHIKTEGGVIKNVHDADEILGLKFMDLATLYEQAKNPNHTDVYVFYAESQLFARLTNLDPKEIANIDGASIIKKMLFDPQETVISPQNKEKILNGLVSRIHDASLDTQIAICLNPNVPEVLLKETKKSIWWKGANKKRSVLRSVGVLNNLDVLNFVATNQLLFGRELSIFAGQRLLKLLKKENKFVIGDHLKRLSDSGLLESLRKDHERLAKKLEPPKKSKFRVWIEHLRKPK
ncbi:MAG: hypothetical protein PHH82_02030 [Candidatus ainarchaeum sp.]|nr:hypothetical protein [Candidatus ainarchaeum sp.]